MLLADAVISACIRRQDMETVTPFETENPSEDNHTAAVTGQQLRDAMGSFLTGVTIVTARSENGAPYGLTVNSFNSVSLDPPLVLWSLDLKNSRTDLFRTAKGFTVNIMAASSETLIRKFASADADRFNNTNWHWGISGQPVLDEALASLECRLWAEYPGGDHAIFVGEVIDIRHGQGIPAAYFNGRLSAFPD